jgi:F-type H+-transporting ATPase subunit b
MLVSAEFWVAVAFFIFLAIVWRAGAFKSIFGGLDARTERVRAELDEAKRLRAEAQATLTEYQKRRAEAEREADAIVAAAREEAERVAREARERLADFVKRRTEAAEARIAQAESDAERQVRNAATETAVRMTEIVLREQLQGPAGEDMLRRSLGEVRGKLHS